MTTINFLDDNLTLGKIREVFPDILLTTEQDFSIEDCRNVSDRFKIFIDDIPHDLSFEEYCGTEYDSETNEFKSIKRR